MACPSLLEIDRADASRSRAPLSRTVEALNIVEDVRGSFIQGAMIPGEVRVSGGFDGRAAKNRYGLPLTQGDGRHGAPAGHAWARPGKAANTHCARQRLAQFTAA